MKTALVVVTVLIDEGGAVSDPKVVRSSGSSEFDRDAMGTVSRWKFKPAVCDGKAVAVHINVEVSSRTG